MPNKIDSNVTGLTFAEEVSGSIGVLPGTPVWYPLEPNDYKDFGGELKLVARNPINPTRQRKKGAITDLDASGGFSSDLTQKNLTRMMQGFLFADIRQKLSTQPLNGTALPITSVVTSTDTYAAASGLAGFVLNDLVYASGFNQAGNNGLKTVASSTATTVVVSENLVDEASPPAAAKLEKVGTKFASATVNVDVSGSWPRLVRASGAVDWTTFGLIPGEWVWLGGDGGGALAFTNAANNGFARVRSVGAAFIEFDKTSATMVTETGTGKTIHMYYGNVIKNESNPSLIKTRSYQLERTLGNDGVGTMSEYLVGSVANELTLNIKQADKVTFEMGFVALNNEQRSGTTGIKSGTRPALESGSFFNTSNDFTRLKLHTITAGNTNPTPLFAFMTDATLKINNNVSPAKAIAVLGAFDVQVGGFDVSGNLNAYFADINGVQAVRNNTDVALDFALVKDNAGMIFDIPLIALGDGRLKIESNKAINLPLNTEAAEGSNGHSFLFNEFPYLPTVAQ